MQYQNVILTLHFTLQNKNIRKRKKRRERQNKDQETLSFACLVIWRRLDNVQKKQTSYSQCSQILRQNRLLEWQDTQW